MKSTENNSILVNEQTVTNEKEKKNSFSKFIKEKRKLEKSPSGKNYISTKELAERLNINYEQFRKILNMNKPTQKRDCIIAICAALRLDHKETNEALRLYQYMPFLSEFNPRDKFIIEILDNNFENYLTIGEINSRLNRNGFKGLDIIDHKSSVELMSIKKEDSLKLLEKKVKTFYEDLIEGDQYDSLAMEYSTDRYRCIAEMWLDDEKNKRRYHLTANTHKYYSVITLGKNNYEMKSYKKAEESEIFTDYFYELEAMANQEMKKMLFILNDTKNYHTRISAGIHNDFLHVYAETFNYTVPELNEYYLFEYKDGRMQLSVFRNSEFMHLYLNSDFYYQTYGKYSNKLIIQYYTLEEIKEDTKTDRYILDCRFRYFKKLKEKSDKLILDIKGKRQISIVFLHEI